MRRVISHRVRLFLLFIHPRLRKNGFKYAALLINVFVNIIWTGSVGPVTSLSVAFISFAKKVAIGFCQFFFSVIEDIVLIEFIK